MYKCFLLSFFLFLVSPHLGFAETEGEDFYGDILDDGASTTDLNFSSDSDISSSSDLDLEVEADDVFDNTTEVDIDLDINLDVDIADQGIPQTENELLEAAQREQELLAEVDRLSQEVADLQDQENIDQSEIDALTVEVTALNSEIQALADQLASGTADSSATPTPTDDLVDEDEDEDDVEYDEDAYTQGYEDGYNQGGNDGYNQGSNQGYNQGYNQQGNSGSNPLQQLQQLAFLSQLLNQMKNGGGPLGGLFGGGNNSGGSTGGGSSVVSGNSVAHSAPGTNYGSDEYSKALGYPLEGDKDAPSPFLMEGDCLQQLCGGAGAGGAFPPLANTPSGGQGQAFSSATGSFQYGSTLIDIARVEPGPYLFGQRQGGATAGFMAAPSYPNGIVPFSVKILNKKSTASSGDIKAIRYIPNDITSENDGQGSAETTEAGKAAKAADKHYSGGTSWFFSGEKYYDQSRYPSVTAHPNSAESRHGINIGDFALVNVPGKACHPALVGDNKGSSQKKHGEVSIWLAKQLKIQAGTNGIKDEAGSTTEIIVLPMDNYGNGSLSRFDNNPYVISKNILDIVRQRLCSNNNGATNTTDNGGVPDPLGGTS